VVFVLRPETETPLYVQIREGLKQEIASGALKPGARLPSSRQLARDLGVSRITATNAYAELEAEGVVEMRAGSGTFVLPPGPVFPLPRRDPREQAAGDGRDGAAEVPPEAELAAPVPSWQGRIGALPVHVERNRMLREAVRSHRHDGVVPFAWARGDVRLFPSAEFRRVLADAIERDSPASLQYGPSEGHPPLRAAIAAYLRQIGVAATTDEVVITAGAQQAIDLIARCLLRPGDRVAVEEPTYPGALEAFEAAGVELVPVPIDIDGMRPEPLERALANGASLVYTVPTFHNPTGVVMSPARRREIVGLAARYRVPVLEDDYLREVRFGSPIPPPLAAFDGCGNVVHIGSFSKSLLPALRLGYVVARGPLRERLILLKRIADTGNSALLQRAIHRHLESGELHSHWKRISRIYRRRQAAMAVALRRHFPPTATWTSPQGGVVMWVRVPGASVARLFDEAIAAGVSFGLGSAFFTRPADQPFMRLNFAAIDEAEIERGVAVLGRLLVGQAREGDAWS
jgi:GntR family transcriptional regulator/MocR family aminotransferase